MTLETSLWQKKSGGHWAGGGAEGRGRGRGETPLRSKGFGLVWTLSPCAVPSAVRRDCVAVCSTKAMGTGGQTKSESFDIKGEAPWAHMRILDLGEGT